jgi:thiol-disulfide isomerase/thioredoxin
MSRSLLITLLSASVSVLLLGACDRAADDPAQPAESSPPQLAGVIDNSFAGTLLPELVVQNADGAELDLGIIEGPMLLNLWATWCAPCVVEMPQLDALAAETEGELRVVTVSQDSRGAEVVTPFFAAKGFARLEPWLDPETQLSAQFSQSGQLPLTILFDASGREVWRVAGGYEWDSPEAIAAVRTALAEQ